MLDTWTYIFCLRGLLGAGGGKGIQSSISLDGLVIVFVLCVLLGNVFGTPGWPGDCVCALPFRQTRAPNELDSGLEDGEMWCVRT